MKKITALVMSLIMIFSTFSVCTISANAATAAPAAVSTQSVNLENDFSLIFKGMFREILNSFMKHFGVKNGFYVTDINIKQNSITVNVGKNTHVTATLEPENVKNNNITWQSENPSIADVGPNGLVVGRKVGSTKIYAIADGGFYDSCVVNVKAADPPVVKLVDSGYCGWEGDKSIAWEFYSDKTLYIKGKGQMQSFSYPIGVNDNNQPWYGFCNQIETVIISDGIINIGRASFDNCRNLKRVSIPDSVTSIGVYAFRNCTSLMNITIPDTVTEIRTDAFYNSGCYNTKSNWIDGVLYIGKNLIEVQDSVTGTCIVKPGTKIIAEGAFKDSNVENVLIADSVLYIGDGAFQFCKNLASVSIGNGVKELGRHAFYYCENLSEITLPDNLKSVYSGTFSNCTSLASITIPISIIEICNNAFYNCKNLAHIYYKGDEDNWNKIIIDEDGNDPLYNATIHFNVSDS